MVVHLRREEEVISADDGHAESGRSAEEGAQRVAAARLRARGVAPDAEGRWDTSHLHMIVLSKLSYPHIRKPSREWLAREFCGRSAKADAHGV